MTTNPTPIIGPSRLTRTKGIAELTPCQRDELRVLAEDLHLTIPQAVGHCCACWLNHRRIERGEVAA